jgi:chemotaxis protein MotD
MDMSANAALGVPMRGVDSGPRAPAAGPDRQPRFSDLLAKLATAGEDKGSAPSGPQPGLSEAGTENAAGAPANLQPEVADLLAKLAAIGVPPAAQEASARSGNGDADASDLKGLMATETASKTDAKEPAPDTEDQLPTGTLPTAASAQQAAFLAMAASASGPLLAATPDTSATHALEDLPKATPALQLPGADLAAKGAPDATGPGFAAAGPRIAVLGQETHIAPAQVAQVAPQPAATSEQGAKAGRGKGDAEPLPTRAAASASGRPGESVQGPSAWDAKSGGEEGADGDEDRASSHPGVSADSAIGSVAKDGARAFGAAPSPTQQVAGRIVVAAIAAQPDGGGIDGASMRAVSSPVIKVLHLELQPADLGTITIRMSLKQDGLDIRLEASRHDTAAMLQRDQEGLAKLLSSAGYRMDGMTVTASAAHGSAGSAQGTDGQASAFQPFQSSDQGSSSQPDARSSGERQSSPSDPRAFSGKQHDDNDTRGAARSTGGDLYV